MKNFNAIYEDVLKESKSELENLRKQCLSRILLTVIGAVCVIVIGFKFGNLFILNLGLVVSIIFCVLLLIGPKTSYKEVYKEKVVKKFIKDYDENLNYYPEKGIPSADYQQGDFENYDRYHSEDLIMGTTDGYKIRMAEVHTECESTDDEGHTSYSTVFHGLFGINEFRNQYNGTIKIRSDQRFVAKFFQSKQRIEMDSEEFEKYFEVMADDKIQAMQILTSDIMDKMITFIQESKMKFELTVKFNRIYIRFKTGNVFEANILKSSVDFDTLKKVYDIINFTFDITKALIKVIEETQL